MMKQYQYIGPDAKKPGANNLQGGRKIETREDLVSWLEENKAENDWMGLIWATYIINLKGCLVVAGRNYEHVVCASQKEILSAGEIAFDPEEHSLEEITNLSTGYCPEPESWEAVSQALDQAGIDHPGNFTHEYIFRKCDHCNQRNVIKDNIFECQVCGSELPGDWNF